MGAAGYPIVAIRAFIETTRDSGYKSTSSAIAELVDNALEADADTVEIHIDEVDRDLKRIRVTDNGIGMTGSTMQLALQFGGSTRFNSRRGLGRYGMGLPNGSLSQARRVDVFSWQNPNVILASYLDIDEISSGNLKSVPEPVRLRPKSPDDYPSSPTGTEVVLSRCDRLDFKTIRALSRKLHMDLGRIFRKQLYLGKSIVINDLLVKPFDPLFVAEGANISGATLFGPPLAYEVSIPGGSGSSPVVVRFSVLPIEQWHSLSNEDKNRHGIAKGAGVSIVRAGREIDYGWYFMGTKRKENYDDWWRCEVCFNPELDELFGVTHTKQRANPTEQLNEILAPDLERTARELNNHVRRAYATIRSKQVRQSGAKIAETRDVLMEPLRARTNGHKPRKSLAAEYEIDSRALEDKSFYLPSFSRGKLFVILNEEHSFFQRFYEPLLRADAVQTRHVLEHVQLLLLAAGRAECAMKTSDEKSAVRRLRESWSNALTAFLD
jgi:hypothetical protein